MFLPIIIPSKPTNDVKKKQTEKIESLAKLGIYLNQNGLKQGGFPKLTWKPSYIYIYTKVAISGGLAHIFILDGSDSAPSFMFVRDMRPSFFNIEGITHFLIHPGETILPT